MNNAGLSYCGQVVKEQDPDRFLISMFMPGETREALWALFAFNYEIAKTREVVTETQLGLIRLQWWREAIEEIYKGGEIKEHEVLMALAKAIEQYDLPQEPFENLIYAREFDLEDVLPGNLDGLLNYAHFTTTPLLQLALKVLGSGAEAELLQPVAVNYALSGLLRAVLFHAKQRRCYLPQDLMDTNKVKVSQLYELKPQEGLVEVIRSVSDEIVPNIQTEHKFLALSQKLAEMYAGQLKKIQHDIFDPKALISPPFKEFRLMWRARSF